MTDIKGIGQGDQSYKIETSEKKGKKIRDKTNSEKLANMQQETIINKNKEHPITLEYN